MFKDRRILIFTGGKLGSWALDYVEAGDFLLGADRGAHFLLTNNLQPDFAIGDFDSLTESQFQMVRQMCSDVMTCDPILKDYTDTEMAFNWALDKKPAEIILLGATGTRFDHTLANVHLLRRGLYEGIPCRIIDENNEITLIKSRTEVSKERYSHVSLLPLSPMVTGITLGGFRYPLNNATLNIGCSLGISNVLEQQTGTINVEFGELLVIKTND